MFPKGTATFTQGSKTVSSISMSAGDISAVARGSRLDLGTLTPPANIIEAVDRDISANTITLRDNFNGTTGTYSFIITYTSDGFRDAATAMRDARESLVLLTDTADVNPNPDTFAQRDVNGNVKTGEPIADDDATPYSISRALVRSYATTTELENSRPTQTGQRAENRERANAQYELAASGYTAQPGDIVSANGRVWELQIDGKGMSVSAFGADFDSALSLAVNRCQGICPVIISESSTTSGVSFSGLQNVTIKLNDGVVVDLADSSDTGMLAFSSCSNITVTGGQLNGNVSGQTGTSTSNSDYAIFFDSCDGCTVLSVDIVDTMAGAVRALNSQNVEIKITGSGASYIPIYIGPSGSGGVDVDSVYIHDCNYDWSETPAPTSDVSLCSITTNDATKSITNVRVLRNTFKQNEDSVGSGNACIAIRNAQDYIVSDNIVSGGEIPITLVSGSERLLCANNIINGDISLYGIEIAGGASDWQVIGNNITDSSGNGAGIQINGGSSSGIVANNTAKGVVDAFKVSPPSLTESSSDITFTGNNADCSGRAYSLKYINDFSIRGGAAKTTDATAVISLESSTDGSIEGVRTGAASTFFIRVAGTEQTLNNLMVQGNTIHELTQFDRYIRDTTSGVGIGSGIKYINNSNGPDIWNYENNLLDCVISGTPEGAVSAGVGSKAIRTDGGTGSTLYVKESGTGNTGWAAK